MKAAEVERLQTAIDEIRLHGTDAPPAANYPEAVWWRRVAEDCMRIAQKAAEAAGRE